MQSSAPTPSLEDRQAIADVTIRYCWSIDGRDWAELANVFTEDAVADFGFAAEVRGLPAIQAFITRALGSLDCSQHMVTNHQVENREGELRSRCYFHAQHTRKGLEGGANYVIAGIYRDVWADTPAGWRIRARKLEVLWTEGNVAVVARPASGS